MRSIRYALFVAVVVLAASPQARADAPCYGDHEKIVAAQLWQDDEVRAWFQDKAGLARTIASTACTFVFTKGAINKEDALLLRAKLKGSEVPEDIEEAQQGEGLEYYRLFAALFYEHAIKMPPLAHRQAKHH